MIPALFLDRLKRIVGTDHIAEVVQSLEEEKTTSFRVNTLKGNTESVVQELRDQGITIQDVPWCPEAYLVEPGHRDALTHSRQAIDGEIFVQGLSSILATRVLDPKPGEWNLDLAAAPGGKASHMAAMMGNDGKLSVVEPVRKRMYRLADNLKRLGVTLGKTYLMDGRKVGQKVPDRFDRVLLDAPCSSESRIRVNNPDSYQYWSERKIREQSRKQAGLILSAFAALKPGGTMLYGTCSFAPEENESIVNHLLNRAGEQAEVVSVELPIDNWQPGLLSFEEKRFDEALTRTRRILPNRSFDGFYLASIRKKW